MTIKKIKDSTGQEHGIDYNALENLPTYQSFYHVIAQDLSIAKEEVLDFDLTDLLPKDDYVYSVAVQVRFSSGASASAVYASSDVATNAGSYLMCRGLPAGQYLGGSANVLVGSGRRLTILNATSAEITQVMLIVSHYFRVS